MKPIITVIMSVYNADDYLEYTIASIMNQTFKDFEAIIINDASNDNTKLILSKIKDPRFIIINNTVNKGLTVNLNTAINMARGEYIVRIDSDDICLKSRLERQLSYMQSHPSVDVLGSNAYLIDTKNKIVGITDEETNERTIKVKTLLLNPFIHPAIMAKASILKKYLYDEHYRTCQDFELWVRIQKDCIFANLKEPLIFYRINNEGATRSARKNITARIELLLPIVSMSLNINAIHVTDDKIRKVIDLVLQAHCFNDNDVYNAYLDIRNKDIDSVMAFSCLRYYKFSLLAKREFRLFIIGVMKSIRYYYRIFALRCFTSSARKELQQAVFYESQKGS